MDIFYYNMYIQDRNLICLLNVLGYLLNCDASMHSRMEGFEVPLKLKTTRMFVQFFFCLKNGQSQYSTWFFWFWSIATGQIRSWIYLIMDWNFPILMERFCINVIAIKPSSTAACEKIYKGCLTTWIHFYSTTYKYFLQWIIWSQSPHTKKVKW